MNFLRTRMWFGLVLSIMLANLSYAENVTLYVVDYPPYMTVDDQTVGGTDSRVVIEALRTQGVTAELKAAPWKRTEKNLKHGRVAGALSCSYREHRTAYITYSDALSSAHQAAIASRDVDLSKLKTFDDLNNYKVITIEGWGIQKELEQQGINHTLTNSMENALNAILNRGIDIFYAGEESALYKAKELGVRSQLQAKRIEGSSYTDFFLCLSKDYPGTQGLVRKFNQGLAEIKASGRYQAIHDQYLH